MGRLKAEVRNGRLVMDEPTDLPDGTIIELSVADDEDELDDRERAVLHGVLERSWSNAAAGNTRPARAILEELRTKA